MKHHHCSVCSNELTEIVEAEFQIFKKINGLDDYRCRHHVIVLVDLFVNENSLVPNNELVLIRIKEN